jgi:hypothetical protein
LPIFRFDRAFDLARDVRAFLSGKWSQRQEFKRVRSKIQSRRQERQRMRNEVRAAKYRAGEPEQRKWEKRVRHKSSQPGSEVRAAKGQRPEGEKPETTGSLPDFLVIGAKKCGTTSLYHLLIRHPLVERAAAKELHFFDLLFDEGTEWYRRCFPTPRWKDGRKTITGEATPMMTHRLAPKRVAQVVPHAQLIALLRNPVDRAYSDYQQVANEGREPRTFKETIGLEKETEAAKAHPFGERSEPPEGRDLGGLDEDSEYLSRGVYVDQLLRWSEFFPKEQLLVLKSEDFFEHPLETLKVVLSFLGLPEWEPKAWDVIPKKRNKGKYEEGMDPATRRLLEEYFEPHNQRLYDFLGRDLGW